MSQQSRSQETQALFLSTVSKHLSERGETALKLAGICEEVGMTQTAIYYHFGSREAVIDAAYLEFYKQITNANLKYWLAITSEPNATQMYEKFLSLQHEEIHSNERKFHQRMHVRILSATTLRRQFKVKYETANEIYMSQMTRLFQEAQDRGSIGTKFTARQVAILVEHVMVSQSLAQRSDDSAANEESNFFVEGMFFANIS